MIYNLLASIGVTFSLVFLAGLTLVAMYLSYILGIGGILVAVTYLLYKFIKAYRSVV